MMPKPIMRENSFIGYYNQGDGMMNMDKKTHKFLTLLLYIGYIIAYIVVVFLNDDWRIPISILTLNLFISTYSHIKYYRSDHVKNKGKIALVVQMVFVFILVYFDQSNYEQLFMLLLIGDCIFAYNIKFSLKYVVGSYGLFFLYINYVFVMRRGYNYSEDVARDLVIIIFSLLILYLSKYQINEKMKYNILLKQRNNTYEKLRKYALRIEDMAVLEERNRIALMLHNSLGHRLVSISLSLQAEKMELVSSGEIDQKAFIEVEKQIQKAMTLLRRTIENSDDFMLDTPFDELMELFINDVSNHTKMAISYKGAETHRIPSKLKNIIYNIVLESVTNALKHSKGQKISVDIKCDEDEIVVSIRDNGIGFGTMGYGYGMTKISDQVKKCDGKYHISSKNGCIVEVILPVKGGK